jgi:hypothetical protein
LSRIETKSACAVANGNSIISHIAKVDASRRVLAMARVAFALLIIHSIHGSLPLLFDFDFIQASNYLWRLVGVLPVMRRSAH